MNNALETILKHPIATTIITGGLVNGIVRIICTIKGVDTEKK